MNSHIALIKNHGLRGEVNLPADKSILHRAILLNSVAHGECSVKANGLGRDNLATLRVMRQLGVDIEVYGNKRIRELARSEGIDDVKSLEGNICSLNIRGRGFGGLRSSKDDLYCGNSGTTARFLTGILSGRPFKSRLTGDASLSKRPFKRVTGPLSSMGARFSGETLPLVIEGGELGALEYDSPIASAQVKSAILLAGLQASGVVSVREPFLSRDHTERLLQAQGIKLIRKELEDGSWLVEFPAPGKDLELKCCDVEVPGDFSHAAFLIVAAILIPNSDVILRNIGFNPTRIGFYDILKRMGASIEILNPRYVGGEEVVDLHVCHSSLNAVDVTAADVVRAIDEIPILSVAAAFARGNTEIRGAGDLRVKESDRLAMISSLLKSYSIVVEEYEDGLRIDGNPSLSFGGGGESIEVDSDKRSFELCGDHRILMSQAVLELSCRGKCLVRDRNSIETSFPDFVECLQELAGRF